MKYNWSIIGHEKQLLQIEKDLESGNLAHAYLLSGPNSVGKNTVAKKMAGILQCENDFCHSCNSCIQIEKGCHVDTVVFEDDGESIKIETVRKILERLSMTRQAQYKILLIQSVERMGIEAANSFLKMLEEPPERTVFIMTTDNIRLILPTILSRVRVVQFNSVSQVYLKEKLESLYPERDAETLETVSLLSMGKTGKAVHLMEHPESLAEYLKIYHDIQNFLNYRSVVERFSYIEEMAEDPKRIETFMNILTHVVRSKMLGLKEDSANHTKALSKIDEAAMLLKKNVNVRLVLENLMLQI
ncbi:MAG: DNA polymerase III subunit [Candidatus Peregrinibacteria bacterium]|nr:DNA polymerase III subunit [Candidatus Peregrinibacteria bacterium]